MSGFGEVSGALQIPERDFHDTDHQPRIRVALIHYRDSAIVGGALRVGELLGRNLERANVEPHFVFGYGGPGPVAGGTSAACHFVRAHGPKDIAAWLRARSLVGALRPDILHFVDPVFWMSLALCGDGRPRVLHVHGPMLQSTAPFVEECIWRTFRRLMSGFVYVSRNMETKFLAADWGVPDKSWTVYNAVECGHWANRFDRAETRARLGLPQDKIILGMMCRLAPIKGCDDAVRLLERLPERYHLAIAGDGSERANILKLAIARQVDRRVHMLGVLDDARLAYSAMDNLLFLSRSEPFGLLLAEAMAAGVPIVGLAGEGGYREDSNPLVTSETAVLLDRPTPEDVLAPAPERLLDRLAAEVQELNGSPERREAMVRRARQWVRERFDARQYVAAVAHIYRELLTGSARMAPNRRR
jgi:glycosyltransferase involved in cell wall biosynthesis